MDVKTSDRPKSKTSVSSASSASRTSASSSPTGGRKIKAFSAGIVPVYMDPHEDPHHLTEKTRFLLLRSYNYWDFPKGGVLPGESPLQAARRELEEETTLVHAALLWGDEFRETPVYANGKVARYYVAQVARLDISLPINPQLGRAEHQEFRWVTYDEALELINPRVLAILDWARELIKTGPTSSERGDK